MSSLFPNGTKYAISTALATAIAVTAISDANPAVASAANPPAANAIGVLTSGWSDINNRVVRAITPTENGFTLDGIDTSEAANFPAGESAGAFQVVSGWTPIDQVANVASSGGDQQYYTWQYVEDTSGRQQQKPTVKNPLTMTLTLDYDPDKPWFAALIAADRARQPVVLRAILPSGVTMYYLVFPSFNEAPTQTVNQNMQNVATFSLINAPVRYKAAA